MSWLITGTQKTDPDALAYLAEVERADGQALESGTRDAVIAFVTGCKADGIWTAIKASCILAGARTLEGALVPLAGTAPTSFNFVAGDYDRKTGLAGDGTTKYLNSNRLDSAEPLNSIHLAVYYSNLGSGSIALIGVGSGNANFATQLLSNVARARSATAFTYPPPPPTQNRFLACSRNESAKFLIRHGNINSELATSSVTTGGINHFVFARNDNNTPITYSNARLAFYSIGESLNLALLDARVTDLINAIGAAIPS